MAAKFTQVLILVQCEHETAAANAATVVYLNFNINNAA